MRFLLALMLMLPGAVLSAECTARSGPQSNAVVELYTSEGCSSCPPADRWLSTLAPGAASGRVVPLAFHVNYWDYIGWKDPFASARATERQRGIATATGSRYVYTPQVVVGGRDTREWREPGATGAIEAIQRKSAPVTIELALKVDPVRGIEVDSIAGAVPGFRTDPVIVLVAVTQNGLASRVTAGENSGERLAHDFVVRDFTIHRGLGRARTSFKPAPGWNVANMSVAAFVQDPRSGEILQALSTPLCRS